MSTGKEEKVFSRQLDIKDVNELIIKSDGIIVEVIEIEQPEEFEEKEIKSKGKKVVVEQVKAAKEPIFKYFVVVSGTAVHSAIVGVEILDFYEWNRVINFHVGPLEDKKQYILTNEYNVLLAKKVVA